MLGLRFCARAFSSCGERGPPFIAVHGPLTIAASLVAEHRFQMRRLSSCGSRAQLLHGMWDLPRPGLVPVSPALAGTFSTTAPPGKPPHMFFLQGDVHSPLEIRLVYDCRQGNTRWLLRLSQKVIQLPPHPLGMLVLAIQLPCREEVERSQPRAWINCLTCDYESLQEDCSPATVWLQLPESPWVRTT